MLDTTISIGFMGKEVRERLDDSLKCIQGIKRTGYFHYVNENIRLRHKTKNEIVIGICEHEGSGEKYVDCRVLNSLVRILYRAEDLEIIESE